MPALVVAVLIAYDYECARKLSASLFFGVSKTSISGFVAVGPHCIYIPGTHDCHLCSFCFTSKPMSFFKVCWGNLSTDAQVGVVFVQDSTHRDALQKVVIMSFS